MRPAHHRAGADFACGCIESVDLAAGTADLFVARADRGLRRRSDGAGHDSSRLESSAPGHRAWRLVQDADLYRGRSRDGLRAWLRFHGGDLMDLSTKIATASGQAFS